MPSRTSQVRLRSSSTSKMRTLWAAWCQPPVVGKYGERASSPVCPKGEWPTSWPSAMASASVSLSDSAAASDARDLGHLEGVRQARDVVVALGVDEHLRLVLEPAEGLGVEDPVAVALEGRPVAVGRLRDAGDHGWHRER